MNITEANNVQWLLDWVLGVEKPGGGRWDEDDAREFAVFLADRSYKALSAGMNGDQVRTSWPWRPPRP